MKPFDYINSINTKREPPEDISGYNPYLTNHSFAAFTDTVMLANEMNLNSHLDKQLQFDFLYHAVRQGKRFSKWLKGEKEEDIELICKFYGYSYEKAKQVQRILTRQQLDFIRDSFDTGGKQ